MTDNGTYRDIQLSMLEGMDRPVGAILESVFVGSNADLMKAVAPLYLTGSVLDVTYGGGKWWDRYRPEPFTFHDLALDGVDFRSLPYADGAFDTVAFDPPYVDSGTNSSPRLGPDFQHRYGIGSARVKGRAVLVTLILDGLNEACRVSRRFVLVKCMEYAQGSGACGFHDIPHLVTNAAADAGWCKHDQIVHYTGTGPGGHNIFRVKRARRAHSYLLVFCRG
jgi:hypothetical protein